MKDSYVRFLELIVMYHVSGKSGVGIMPKYKHSQNGLHLDIVAFSLDSENEICRYNHVLSSGKIDIKEIDSYNEILKRCCEIVGYKISQSGYVSICPNCMGISIGVSKKNRLCVSCLKKMSNAEILSHAHLVDGKMSHIYLIIDESNKNIKIGLSKNPQKRLSTLQTGSSNKLTLLYFIPGGQKMEKEFHEKFKQYNIR